MRPLTLDDLRPQAPLDPDGLEAARILVLAQVAQTAQAAADGPDEGRDDAADAGVLPLRPRRVTPRRVAAMTAAAAAVAAVAVLVPNPSDPVAFAGWSTVPSAVGDLEALGAECIAIPDEVEVSNPQDEDPQDVASRSLRDAVAKVGDRRGSTSLVVLTSPGGGFQSCVIGPDFRLASVVGPTGSSFSNPSGDLPGEGAIGIGGDRSFPSAGEATFASGDIVGIGGDPALGIATGRVGEGVTGVELTLSDGTVIQATVANGLWAAWWPTQDVPAGLTPIGADGTRLPTADLDADEYAQLVWQIADAGA
ncbi:hypothetical protein [Cellulomonas composti]|uniref:Uncharacterized protein n=1 Tax=Cellulomonas composti TaxID=266130 RepID=A0A511J7Y9_9CELL|nr:hypothetical protein [Cellulomonas composti]GEL94098.1 hypothetical protein CCO02nite_07560 [Cellulomonas composti]